MSHHQSADDLTHLYEGDQSKLYSGVYNHHSDIKSKESKDQVRRIWKITLYLAIVTVLEVSLGLWDHHQELFNKGVLAAIFLVMTVLKAYLIVDVFMHLGNEIRNFVMAVVIPLILFVWFISSFLADGAHWLHMNNTRADTEQVEAK